MDYDADDLDDGLGGIDLDDGIDDDDANDDNAKNDNADDDVDSEGACRLPKTELRVCIVFESEPNDEQKA